MRTDVWENFISLNPSRDKEIELLGPVSEFLRQPDGSVVWDYSRLPLDLAVSRDTSPLPVEADRELYYGPNHFNYWASGLRDYFQIREWCERNGVDIRSILDIGCASGRVIRHLHYQTDIETVIGCDINRLHVDWVADHLPREIGIFQNTSVPYLPLPDASLDMVTAFSVFTHIEMFDTAWLMELRRVLKPGGIAWLTVHSDRTWTDMKPTWPIYNALVDHADFKPHAGAPRIPSERFVVRWLSDRSYSSNVFYREDYLRRVWGRIMNFKDIFPALPEFQDIVVLQK